MKKLAAIPPCESECPAKLRQTPHMLIMHITRGLRMTSNGPFKNSCNLIFSENALEAWCFHFSQAPYNPSCSFDICIVTLGAWHQVSQSLIQSYKLRIRLYSSKPLYQVLQCSFTEKPSIAHNSELYAICPTAKGDMPFAFSCQPVVFCLRYEIFRPTTERYTALL